MTLFSTHVIVLSNQFCITQMLYSCNLTCTFNMQAQEVGRLRGLKPSLSKVCPLHHPHHSSRRKPLICSLWKKKGKKFAVTFHKICTICCIKLLLRTFKYSKISHRGRDTHLLPLDPRWWSETFSPLPSPIYPLKCKIHVKKHERNLLWKKEIVRFN